MHPNPVKNIVPIKIINFPGLEALTEIVAGSIIVYTGVISCTLAYAICNCCATLVYT